MPELKVNVSEEFFAKLEILAADMGCSLEQCQLLALEEFYTEERANADALLKGLKDVEAGRVVPHEAVVAWLESLGTEAPLPRPVSGEFAELRAS